MPDADAPAPKKKGKGMIIILAVLGVLLLAGGGVGFAVFKGLGPFAKKAVPRTPVKPKVAKRSVARPPAPAPNTMVRTLPPTTKVDPEEGAMKLAKLWNELEAPKLLAIARDWKDPELARVATKMEPEKVAEVLAAMPPKRASSLSREMQRLASVVPIEN